jgi:acyl carrier protein
MNESELKDIIIAELAKIALGSDPAALDLDDNLREGLDIDSFDALNFFIALSERLHIDISEKDMGKLNTMGEILHYLQVQKGLREWSPTSRDVGLLISPLTKRGKWGVPGMHSMPGTPHTPIYLKALEAFYA